MSAHNNTAAAADADTPNFGYDSTSPAPSPVLDTLNHFNFPASAKSDHSAMMTMEDDSAYHHHQHGYTPYDSTYSTINGWAGEISSSTSDTCSRAQGDFIASFAMDAVVGGYQWPQGSYGESFQQYSTGLGAFNFDGSVGVA